MYQNLKKVWRWWGIITRVLAKKGARVQSHGIMNKAVAQSVLLYRIES